MLYCCNDMCASIDSLKNLNPNLIFIESIGAFVVAFSVLIDFTSGNYSLIFINFAPYLS